MLWEVFIAEDLIEKSGQIERLVKEIPTVSEVEAIAKECGLKKLSAKTAS